MTEAVKIISSLILVLLGAAIVVFAVNNLQPATIDPWPVAGPMDVPTYLIVLVVFLAGFFAGAIVAWVSGFAARRRAARQARDAEKRQAELGDLKTKATPAPLVPTGPSGT
ncbi:MAG: LapA family protein [Alphaproteobacteria bacterium]|nr:LapA family protein [Alphaproteobacteria bacterium]